MNQLCKGEGIYQLAWLEILGPQKPFWGMFSLGLCMCFYPRIRFSSPLLSLQCWGLTPGPLCMLDRHSSTKLQAQPLLQVVSDCFNLLFFSQGVLVSCMLYSSAFNLLLLCACFQNYSLCCSNVLWSLPLLSLASHLVIKLCHLSHLYSEPGKTESSSLGRHHISPSARCKFLQEELGIGQYSSDPTSIRLEVGGTGANKMCTFLPSSLPSPLVLNWVLLSHNQFLKLPKECFSIYIAVNLLSSWRNKDLQVPSSPSYWHHVLSFFSTYDILSKIWRKVEYEE